MWKYGQYCPVAHALEVVGERWTLLIIRDMMNGTKHFNDLERGLPGISRGLLSKRLQQLAQTGLIEKKSAPGRHSTEYHLTEAGYALHDVIDSLLKWGTEWVFGDPAPEEMDSGLLMWWMHKRIRTEHLTSDERVTIQFNFYGAETVTYWLVLSSEEVNLCMTDPGFEINILVTADIAALLKVWLGRTSYQSALESDQLKVEGSPRLTRAFPNWFALSPAAPEVRRARISQQMNSLPFRNE